MLAQIPTGFHQILGFILVPVPTRRPGLHSGNFFGTGTGVVAVVNYLILNLVGTR